MSYGEGQGQAAHQDGAARGPGKRHVDHRQVELRPRVDTEAARTGIADHADDLGQPGRSNGLEMMATHLAKADQPDAKWKTFSGHGSVSREGGTRRQLTRRTRLQ